MIRPGTLWKEEIEQVLAEAKVAVLLVSADFLASNFIANNELPPLLARAEQNGTVILPVIVGPSRFAKTEGLFQFQAVNPPDRPLSALSRAEQEQIWVRVTEAIVDALTRRPVRIFISSPGDVADERALAIQVIERLQYDPLLSGEIRLEPVAWDRPGGGAPMITWLSPQAAINYGLPRPSQCAIVVCILWSRIGTPLPRDSMLGDAEEPLTGTEWEFWDAMNAPPETRPIVLMYRCLREVKIAPDSPDYADKLIQLQGVHAFFAAFTDEQGYHRFSVHTYNEPSEFKEKLERHLRQILKDLIKADAATSKLAQSQKTNNGQS